MSDCRLSEAVISLEEVWCHRVSTQVGWGARVQRCHAEIMRSDPLCLKTKMSITNESMKLSLLTFQYCTETESIFQDLGLFATRIT